MELPSIPIIARIARSFGTKVSVCSLIWVAAWNMAITTPTIILVSRKGIASLRASWNAWYKISSTSKLFMATSCETHTTFSCLFARLGDKEGFYEHYTALIKDFATVSLLDLHPPRIFQIDGNLGAVAAGIEAMVSFYDNTAHLLKALPEQWKNGRLKGIKIPGGHKLDMAWENGKLARLAVILGYEGEARLECQGKEFLVKGAVGETVSLI